MRQKLAKAKMSHTTKPLRRRNANLPAVPTFQAEPDFQAEPKAAATAPSSIEDDQAQEAVRRLVEAAYT